MQHTNFNNYPLVDLYSNYMMIFSRSLKMKIGYQLITTKYHMSYPIMSIDFTNFSQNLLTLGITEEIVVYRILSESKYSMLSDSEKRIQGYNHPSMLKTQFLTLSLPQLFELSFFNDYILNCSEIELSRNIVFVIEDIRYLDLLAELKNHKVILTGGSFKFQHLLSPVRYRLSQIIACLENGRQKGVNNSYHIPKKLDLFGGNLVLESTKPNLNWIAMNLANKSKSNSEGEN
jgi:hypothetical protein